MPRPVEESKFRRLMMQGIMWVILGATVGLAALVNQSRQRSPKVSLDAPRKLDGFSIQFPKGWEDSDVRTGENEAIAMEDPEIGDVLIVSMPGALSNIINNFGRRGGGVGTRAGTVSIAGQRVDITLYLIPSGDGGPPLSRLRVARPLDSGRTLTISLLSPITAQRSDLKPLEYEIEVIKQVAASVKLDAAASTQP